MHLEHDTVSLPHGAQAMTTRCERPNTLPHPAGWNPPFDAIDLVVVSESPPPSVTSDKTDMSSFEDLR